MGKRGERFEFRLYEHELERLEAITPDEMDLSDKLREMIDREYHNRHTVALFALAKQVVDGDEPDYRFDIDEKLEEVAGNDEYVFDIDELLSKLRGKVA